MSALTARGSTRRWRRIRRLILERDGYRCRVPLAGGQLCGAYAEHVDHVRRRVDGGTDDPANLRAACAPHNLGRPHLADTARPRQRVSAGWSW